MFTISLVVLIFNYICKAKILFHESFFGTGTVIQIIRDPIVDGFQENIRSI